MKAHVSGFGITVETDTGKHVWLTETGTSSLKAKAIRFDSEAGATMYMHQLETQNPTGIFGIKSFTPKRK